MSGFVLCGIMKMFMKNYLIPHKGNKYDPHIFKPKNMLVVLVVAFVISLASFLGTVVIKNTGLLASIQSAFLVDLANKNRTEENVAVLKVSPVLTEAAQRKANDMVAKGYFAHTSPEGITPWYWFKDVNYSYIFAGENLAVNFTESVDVHKAWIASPTHKKNILDQRFTEIGIATADGFYKGKKATFVVQMFGKPRSSLLPSLSASVSSQEKTVPIVISGPDTNSKQETTKVFGVSDEETSITSQTNMFQRLAVSPISVGKIIILSITAILCFALLLRLFIEFKKHHRGRAFLLLIVIVILALLAGVQDRFLGQTEIVEGESQTLSES